MFAIDFSVIWLHPLLYFGAWTDSLEITHCTYIETNNLPFLVSLRGDVKE